MDYVQALRAVVGPQPLILVAAGVLILDAEGRLLLQCRAESGLWGIPGGCLELGETLEEAARREVQEETGLLVGDLSLFGAFSGDALRYTCPNGDQVQVVSIVYKAADFSGELFTDGEESRDLRFFLPSELPKVELTPANQPVIQQWLKAHGELDIIKNMSLKEKEAAMPTVVIDDTATVTIDKALATRLRALRETHGDLDTLVSEALAEAVRRWEREAQGRAEMQAMLDGPRHSFEESHARMRQKFGFPDLSHLTADELADQAEATLAELPPEKIAEAQRLGRI